MALIILRITALSGGTLTVSGVVQVDNTFTLDGGRFIDVETGTSWDAVRRIALEGALKGEVLDLLPGFTSFPSDYFTFWPEGRLWTGE